ncbi:MAG: RHS repeat-associated core domain-containing protein [Verrucomicrobiales bacterium]
MQSDILARSAVPRQVSLEGIFGGLAGGEPVFLDTSTLSESRDETFIGGLVFDACHVKTGFAPYTIRATSHFARSSVSGERTAEAVVFNRVASPYGAGWGLHGSQSIVRGAQGSGRHLLVSGDGSYTLFRDSTQAFTLGALGSPRATTYSFAEGEFFSQARDAIKNAFDGAVIEPIESIAAGTKDLLVLTPYASSTEGLSLTTVEQAALMSFIRGGGAAVVFLDHDLGRESFREAMTSILQPFGLVGENSTSQGGSVPVSNHPLLTGEFGRVAAVDLPFGGFELETGGTALENVVSGESPTSSRLAILPENSLGVGAGPIIFVADTQAFTNDPSVGIQSNPSYSALLLNAIKYCREAQRDPAASIEYVGSPGDPSLLIERVDGTFERRMPNGVSFLFDTRGQMVEAIGRDGQSTQFTYSAVGALTQITDPFGKQTRLHYSSGKLASIADPVGHITTLSHDEQGNLVKVTFPDSTSNAFEYDEKHLMTAEVNALGGRTVRSYDLNGLAQSVVMPDGTERKVASIQGIAADRAGALGSESDPAPIKRPEDLVATYTNAADETYAVEIGPLGTATKVTKPDGSSDLIVRNASGKAVETRFASGRIFSSVHDRQGRRIALTDSATGNTWTTVYDNVLGVPVVSEDGQGNVSSVEFDPEGRLRQFTTHGGRTMVWDYDGATVQSSKIAAFNGMETAFGYDASGNVVRIAQGTGDDTRDTILTRTASGYIQSVTTALGDTFHYQYDQVGGLVSQTYPDGSQVQYAYNAQSLPAIVTVPSGARHRFEYDSRGRATSYSAPAGVDLNMTYEYNGGRLSRIAASGGPDIRYRYADGRLAGATTPDGPTNLIYNDKGMLERILSPEGNTLGFTYDAGGRAASETWSGAASGTVTRNYDALNRISSIKVSDQSPTMIRYNADHQIVGVDRFEVTRNPDSGAVEHTRLGRCTDERSYNAFGELVGIVGKFDGNEIYRLTLVRDKWGRITNKREESQNMDIRSTFAYDLNGRLSNVARGGETIEYTYDRNGNRISRNVSGGGSEAGVYNAGDQVESYNGTAYSFDRAGRLNQRGGDSFVYDAFGVLKRVSIAGQSTIEYEHDPVGRRIREKSSGSTRRGFLYLGSLNPIAELNASGTVRTTFGYATAAYVPEFMIRDGVTYRVFSDNLGSPRIVMDCDNGTVAQVMHHDEFGRVLQDTSPGFQPFGFAGGLYDPATMLHRFGSRDYDAETGRWTAIDPIGFKSQSYNLYSYVSGDPVNRFDPTGLKEYDGPSVMLGATVGLDWWAYGGSLTVGIAFDATGNVGIVGGYSHGPGAGAQGDVSFVGSVTKGDIFKMRGAGKQKGGGGGALLNIEEYALQSPDGNIVGNQFSVGGGGGWSVHVHDTNTGVAGFNIPNAYNSASSWVGSFF